MAQINWTDVEASAKDIGGDLLAILKPYLPALVREGPDVYVGFIQHLSDGNWEQIDQLMYAKMTLEERHKLEDQVYQGLLAAAKAKYRQKELIKEVGFKIFMNLLLRVATGGLL